MYVIAVVGRAERTLVAALDDLVDEWHEDPAGGNLVAHVTDQARLVAVIDRLHDLGATIDHVRQL